MYEESIDDPRQFNRIFLKRLDEPGGIQKTAAATRSFIQLRIRERGFARHIIPPEIVTADDCQAHEDHDLPTKLVQRAFDESDAMSANFLGGHDGRYIKGDRVRAKFYKIETLEYYKQEAEILQFDYPITEYIEKISVKDIERVEDEKLLELSNAAVAQTGKLIISPQTAVDRQALTTLFKMIDGDELQFDCILMHKVDFDDWCSLPATDVGNDVAKEMTVGGWQYQTLQGHKLITTIKTVIEPGHLYGFTKPELLGVFYLLGDTRFAIKKEYDMIYMKAWQYISMLFPNTRSVAKYQLTVPNPLTGA
jgi:hypothetical protein